MNEIALHYKDICLLPKYSMLSSRSEADCSINFLNNIFKLPVVPSNMTCVIDEERAKWLDQNGYFYIMHRFGNTLDFVRNNKEHLNTISISVGVKKEDHDLIKKLADDKLMDGKDYITVDIAHGHSYLMKDMISRIVDTLPVVNIIAGNVATRLAYYDLVSWGADVVKIGIGGGSACSTKNKTGFTKPMYSCVSDIQNFKLTNGINVPIIADGGIREHADIVKAIHAGADMVMAGGLFSKLIDSPAEIIDGHKIYFGSASQFNKGEYKHVEGIKKSLELDTMTYHDKLLEIEQDLKSAISYSGGYTLEDIRNAESIQVSHWEA